MFREVLLASILSQEIALVNSRQPASSIGSYAVGSSNNYMASFFIRWIDSLTPKLNQIILAVIKTNNSVGVIGVNSRVLNPTVICV